MLNMATKSVSMFIILSLLQSVPAKARTDTQGARVDSDGASDLGDTEKLTQSEVDEGSLNPLWKSPGKALGLSLGFTLGPLIPGLLLFLWSRKISAAGIIFLSAGIVFGPSVGHYYVGDINHGVVTTLERLLCLGGSAGLVVMSFVGGNPLVQACVVFSVALGITALGITIADIVLAPRAARRVNEEAGVTLSFAPMVAPTPAGKPVYGLSLLGRF